MRREAGFTFIETLLSLFILVLTIPFVVHILQLAMANDQDTHLSVEQFFVFIRNDAISAHDVTVDGNRLYLHLASGETAKIEQYNQFIRRQVNGQGHEIYLRDVAAFKLEERNEGVKVLVETLEGESYEKTIKLFKSR